MNLITIAHTSTPAKKLHITAAAKSPGVIPLLAVRERLGVDAVHVAVAPLARLAHVATSHPLQSALDG